MAWCAAIPLAARNTRSRVLVEHAIATFLSYFLHPPSSLFILWLCLLCLDVCLCLFGLCVVLFFFLFFFVFVFLW